MTQPPTTQDRIRSILIIVATLATIVFNAMVSTGYVGGVTPDIVSARYPTVLTPAGYAFSIWSLIYLGLISFSVYQALPRNLVRFRSIRSLYLITCVLNCTWIYFFQQEQMAVCLALIAALQFVLVVILVQFRRSGKTDGAILTKGVFGLYAGWVTAAALVNFAVLLAYLQVPIGTTAWAVIGVLSLAAAGGIAAVVRFSLSNYVFPLAVAWAATAIAVKQSGSTGIVIAASICVIACLLMAASYVMDQPEGGREL